MCEGFKGAVEDQQTRAEFEGYKEWHATCFLCMVRHVFSPPRTLVGDRLVCLINNDIGPSGQQMHAPMQWSLDDTGQGGQEGTHAPLQGALCPHAHVSVTGCCAMS